MTRCKTRPKIAISSGQPNVGVCRRARPPGVQAATRTFTDVGGCRGAEGKPSRSQPAGVSRDLLAALSDERHGDPRKVTGSSQRSPLHATGSGRCLHFGKCALMRGTEGSNPAPSSVEASANLTPTREHATEPDSRAVLRMPLAFAGHRCIPRSHDRSGCPGKRREDRDGPHRPSA
jgi:hypothetical protein